MSFLDFTNLISDDQLSELAALNAERAAAGEELITLLDVMADDSVLDLSLIHIRRCRRYTL